MEEISLSFKISKKESIVSLVQIIIGYLNQQRYTLKLTLTIENNLSMEQIKGKIIQELNSKIKNCTIEIGSDSENNVKNYIYFSTKPFFSIVVSPLPHGHVALTSHPFTRSGSHKTPFQPSQWIEKIKKVSFMTLLLSKFSHVEHGSIFSEVQNIKTNQNISVISAGMYLSEEENRFTEFKLPDNLILKNDNLSEYLQDTFSQCILSSSSNTDCCLKIGIHDNKQIIGVSIDDSIDLNFFIRTFPCLPHESITINLQKVFPSCIDDLGNDIIYYLISIDQIQNALLELNGFGIVCIHPEIKNKYILATSESNGFLSYEKLDFVYLESIYGECVWKSRFVLSINVLIPPELDHTILYEADNSVFSYIVNSNQGKPQTMSLFQIWLRTKNIHNEAINSNLYLNIMDDYSHKFLIRKSNQSNQVMSTLSSYLNHPLPSFDYIIDESTSLETVQESFHNSQSNLYFHRISIVFIFTEDCIPYCQELIKLFPSNIYEIKGLMLMYLDSKFTLNLGVSKYATFFRCFSNIDVSLFSNDQMIDQVSIPTFAKSSLISISSSTDNNSNENLPENILKTVKNSILEHKLIPCEYVDQFIMKTQLMESLVETIRLFLTQNTFPNKKYISIIKHYPGSGATSFIRKLSILLNHLSDNYYYIQGIHNPNTLELTAEFENLVNSLMGKPLILLFDDHIPEKVTLTLFEKFSSSSKIVFIQITKFTNTKQKQNNMYTTLSLSPFINRNYIPTFIEPLLRLFPDSNSALLELQNFVTRESNIDPDPNQHIYIIMLTALKQVFVPAKTYIEQVYASLKTNLLNESNFNFVRLLVLLSHFTSFGSLPKRSLPEDCLELFQKDINIKDLFIEYQGFIMFIHPYLAELFFSRDLEMIKMDMREYCLSIQNGIKDLCGSEALKSDVSKSIFIKRNSNHKFSDFIIYLWENDHHSLIENIFESTNKFHFDHFVNQGHLMEALSRFHKYNQKYSKSIHFCLKALEIFESNEEAFNYMLLTWNNMMELYGNVFGLTQDNNYSNEMAKYYNYLLNATNDEEMRNRIHNKYNRLNNHDVKNEEDYYLGISANPPFIRRFS